MNTTIKHFDKMHLQQAFDLIKDYPDVFSEKDLEFYKEDLENTSFHKKGNGSLIIVSESNLVGIIIFGIEGLSENYSKIKWLIVKKDFQGNGYGQTLVNEACKNIKDAGLSNVYLETSNEHHNDKTKHFYQKLGFKVMGVLPDFYPHPISRKRSEDSVIYYKSLE